MNILITGLPGIGKTTLIEQILPKLKKLDLKIAGFITKEIRKNKTRVGFSINMIINGEISNTEHLLAIKNGKRTNYKVGAYNVQIENLNEAVEYLRNIEKQRKIDLVVIDEIGKMELFSQAFKDYIISQLNNKRLLATITFRDNQFTRMIKNRKDVKLYKLTDRSMFKKIKVDILNDIKRNNLRF